MKKFSRIRKGKKTDIKNTKFHISAQEEKDESLFYFLKSGRRTSINDSPVRITTALHPIIF